MSHVDEGALHAYLDGALDEYPPADAARIREHLDRCPECAGRLEEERQIRAEAHGILAMAAPVVEVPSFEELRAYVERTRPAGAGGASRTLRMRWAASVVLALGTGWLLRGGIPGPAGEAVLERPTAGRSEVTASSPATVEPEAVERAQPASRLEAETMAAERQRRAESSPAGQGAAGGGSLADAAPVEEPARESAPDVARSVAEQDVPAVVAENVAVGIAPAEPAVTDLDEARDRLGGASADEVTDVMAGAGAGIPVAEAGAPALPEAARKIGADDRTALVAQVSALAPPPSQESAPAPAAAASTDSSSEETRATSGRADVPAVRALDQAAGASFRARTLGDEEEFPPAVRVTVPGYEVLSITSLGEGTVNLGVRAVQRLEGDTTFSIFHLEPEVDRSVVPPPTDGVREVSRLTEDGWIVVQGPLSEAELERLLISLFPEPEGTEG